MKNETAKREIESLDYYLQNHTNDYSEESHMAMMMAVDALSNLEKPNKWIPVSERLPETGEEVLACSHDTYNKKVIISRYQGRQYGFTCGLVSAWMPLPTPYEPQESEETDG